MLQLQISKSSYVLLQLDFEFIGFLITFPLGPREQFMIEFLCRPATPTQSSGPKSWPASGLAGQFFLGDFLAV